MIIETRQIASIYEVRAIQLMCSRHDCEGILEIDFLLRDISAEEQCPRCKHTWWSAKKSTTALELVRTLTYMRHVQDNDPDAPIVRLVLPGPKSTVE